MHIVPDPDTPELVEYQSKDYTSSSLSTTHKPAYVYVPYGYDPSQKYDVIYLLHGWSPTWDKDNQSKGWGESTQEAAVFSQEYVNDLIPAIETRYSTYLESPDEAGILASREGNTNKKGILCRKEMT